MSSANREATLRTIARITGVHPEKVQRMAEVKDLLKKPDAFLTRSHLRDLGLERRAIDAVFRACPNIVLPGYSRPLIRVSDYLALIEASTDDGNRVYQKGQP